MNEKICKKVGEVIMDIDLENKINELKTRAWDFDAVYDLRQLKSIYGENNNCSIKLAEVYLQSLNHFSIFKSKETSREEIADEAKRVYEQYKASEAVTRYYLSILEQLLSVRNNKDENQEIEIEAKRVYKQSNASEAITRSYLSFLGNIVLLLQNKYELNKIVDDIKEIFNLNQTSKKIAKVCVDTLFEFIEYKSKDADVTYITEAVMEIVSLYPQLIGRFDGYIDYLMVFRDFSKESLSKTVEIIKVFNQWCENEQLIEHSRYSFMFETYGVLSGNDMKRLLEIFFEVQRIKSKLIVRDFKNLKFGHYTDGKVLQIHLKPNIKEDENYKITSKSRLNNVNYMNDPSEGKVLDQFLELDSTLLDSSLKASPWFLMSLTTAIDRLAMWSQYGDQAEGVCLVLNSSDFREASYLNPSNMFKENPNRTLSDYDKGLRALEELGGKNRNKDYIYRIGYLSISGETEAVLKPEFNTCLGETDVNEINSLLKQLKEKIKGIDKINKSVLYEKVDECLEEIRYLFKLADYSYESELRVLRYVQLESNNREIMIDDSGEVAKIYIERDYPIQIEEVIFGPKFPNPENVTPLLQLLDKDIKFSQSKIPFK